MAASYKHTDFAIFPINSFKVGKTHLTDGMQYILNQVVPNPNWSFMTFTPSGILKPYSLWF